MAQLDSKPCENTDRGRVCGHPLALRYYENRKGRMAAAAVCWNCDQFKLWHNVRQAVK